LKEIARRGRLRKTCRVERDRQTPNPSEKPTELKEIARRRRPQRNLQNSTLAKPNYTMKKRSPGAEGLRKTSRIQHFSNPTTQ
jgi:hypothetical protein